MKSKFAVSTTNGSNAKVSERKNRQTQKKHCGLIFFQNVWNPRNYLTFNFADGQPSGIFNNLSLLLPTLPKLPISVSKILMTQNILGRFLQLLNVWIDR